MILSKRADNDKHPKNWRICAIFAPDVIGMTTTTLVSTLQLLEPLAEKIFAITGNFPENVIHSEKIHIININMKGIANTQSPMLVKIPRFIILQLKMSYNLFKITSKFDVVFLAAGASTLFLPALLAKLLGKKIVSLRSGTDVVLKEAKVTYEKTLFGMGKYIFVPAVGIMERLNYRLSDRVVVFRSNFTHSALKRYRNKLFLSGSRFYVDINRFKVMRNLDSREYSVGYIGRFVETGGLMNFVKAISLVLEESAWIKVLISGDGPLRNEIEREIENANLGDKVTQTGWIPHDDIPQYLNATKLLVIPSYQEEGPHILFEAMACGTPVLATPVGVMPDVIEDGETGFIMEDNSPECIAQNITRALNHPNLDKIARNARELIEREYTHQAAVERYRRVLASLE